MQVSRKFPSHPLAVKLFKAIREGRTEEFYQQWCEKNLFTRKHRSILEKMKSGVENMKEAATNETENDDFDIMWIGNITKG